MLGNARFQLRQKGITTLCNLTLGRDCRSIRGYCYLGDS